jgi:hypothetical protein
MITVTSVFAILMMAQPPQATPPSPTPAQVMAAPDARQRLRVFLDCGDCFSEYLRSEISWVDFVRNREDADLHLLSSSNDTGGGGREVVLRFVGVGRFEGADRQLRARTLSGDPEEARRRTVFRTVTVGLLAYLAQDGLPADLGVTVRAANAGPATGELRRDPWNAWVFSIRGGGSINAEESNRQTDWNSRVGADRVTAGWIISFGGRVEEEVERFDLDEDEPLRAVRRERSADWFVARSLGPRWSTGFDGEVETSTFGNTQLSVGFAPAIEFNLFPYSDYATRQFRLQYSVGTMHARYNEVTLFGQLRETRPRHQASATLEQRQPWGSLQAGVDLSQYLHDRSKYNLEVNGEISLRIARGLSMSFDGSASRIRDQLSLPARGATSEEVLLRLRDLQSGYEVGASISLTYTFGSIFNSVVNPRFGR